MVICIDNQSLAVFDPTVPHIMIESMVFFEAYRPVLAALKSLGQDGNLPFADNLLGKSNKVMPPAYLTEPVVTAQPLGAGRKKSAFGTDLSNFSATPAVNLGWDMSKVFPDFERTNGTKYWSPLKNPDGLSIRSEQVTLDVSQQKAIQLALSKRLAIIQGPPGTGS